MYPTKTVSEKIRLFFVIFFPVFFTQIGLALIQFANTVMAGRVGARDLAGVAIANSFWSPVYTGLSGILLAVTPIVSQMLGARKPVEAIQHSVFQALYVAFLLSGTIIFIGILFLKPVFALMELEPAVERIARGYLIALSFGILPLFFYTVLRCFIDALGQTRVTMAITFISLPVNIFFNSLFIYGKFKMPRLGGVGAGVATSITYWITFLVTVAILIKMKPFSEYRIFSRFYLPDFSRWKELIAIGIPIGFSIFFEVSFFAIVTIFISRFGTAVVAAHEAATSFENILYMFPLSVSMTLTILVAYEAGAGRLKDAKQYSRLGIGNALIIAVFCALTLFFFRDSIAGFYTTDRNVLFYASNFLLYAIGYQFSDAIQAPIQGVLRGYKDVNSTFFITLIAYWLIGLPSGLILARSEHLGPYGYWIGLITGLGFSAIGLCMRLIYVQRFKFPEKDLEADTD